MEVDLLLSGGTIIPVDPARSTIEDGAVAISGNRIVAVGKRAYVERAHTAREVIDTTHHVILPGLIDGHGHAGHGLVKSLFSGDGAAWTEACRVIYTLASTPEFWRAEARLTALERLMFGVTTGVSLLGGGDSVMRTDDPAHGIAHAEGVASIGISDIMAVGPTRPPHPRKYASWNGDARSTALVSFEQQLETIQALIETCHRRHTTEVAMLMPVVKKLPEDSEEIRVIERQGRAIRDLQNKHRLLFHQDGHHAGSIAMADEMFGLISGESFLSHCTDLTEADIASLERHNAAVVHNPSAIASVRGYCPVPELLSRGVTVMIGSDGTAPDRSTDMFRHMFQCMRLHQRHARDASLIPPGKALEMVTIDAARGLHMDREIGSLEPGKRADVITIDLRKPHLAPRNMPLWRVVCFASGSDVDTVISAGQVLMRNRAVPHVDIAQVMDEAQRETELMLDRTGLPALFQTWRTALQQKLRGQLGVNATGFVRYVYALPTGIVLLGVAVLASSSPMPNIGLRFVIECGLGGLLQIVGTNLLIMAFGYRNFAVGTAYSKTESVQGAIIGAIVLGEALTGLAWIGIGVGVVGVLVLSLAGRGLKPHEFLRATVQPAALCGLGAGLCFTCTGLFIRVATRGLGGADVVLGALMALVTTNFLQTLMQGSYLAVREPLQFRAAFTTWRSSAWVGTLSACGSACWFFGFASAPVALVRALGQIEMVFTLAFSRFYLRETLRRADGFYWF
eukprot:gene1519-1542_t